MLMICYEKCATCKKAKKFLTDHGIAFDNRQIDSENPQVEELREWITKSGLPTQRFFNTSGLLYRQGNLKEKTKQMSNEEKVQLLATDGMLVKRPILLHKDLVLVGFKESEWKEKLGIK